MPLTSAAPHLPFLLAQPSIKIRRRKGPRSCAKTQHSIFAPSPQSPKAQNHTGHALHTNAKGTLRKKRLLRAARARLWRQPPRITQKADRRHLITGCRTRPRCIACTTAILLTTLRAKPTPTRCGPIATNPLGPTQTSATLTTPRWAIHIGRARFNLGRRKIRITQPISRNTRPRLIPCVPQRSKTDKRITSALP